MALGKTRVNKAREKKISTDKHIVCININQKHTAIVLF